MPASGPAAWSGETPARRVAVQPPEAGPTCAHRVTTTESSFLSRCFAAKGRTHRAWSWDCAPSGRPLGVTLGGGSAPPCSRALPKLAARNLNIGADRQRRSTRMRASACGSGLREACHTERTRVPTPGLWHVGEERQRPPASCEFAAAPRLYCARKRLPHRRTSRPLAHGNHLLLHRPLLAHPLWPSAGPCPAYRLWPCQGDATGNVIEFCADLELRLRHQQVPQPFSHHRARQLAYTWAPQARPSSLCRDAGTQCRQAPGLHGCACGGKKAFSALDVGPPPQRPEHRLIEGWCARLPAPLRKTEARSPRFCQHQAVARFGL